MKTWLKRSIRATVITVCSILLLIIVAVAIAVNFVFTPAKLTPIVLGAANENLDAHLEIESVELTFFSTFPRFGVRLDKGSLVSMNSFDTVITRRDSLISFDKCVLEFNPMAYARSKKIDIYNILIDRGRVYAYVDSTGRANWDIVKVTEDFTDEFGEEEEVTFDDSLFDEINVRNIELRRTKVTFNDKPAGIYARVSGANARIDMSMTKKHSAVNLEFESRSIVFRYKEERMIEKLSASIRTRISADNETNTYTLSDTELTLNGITLDVDGTIAPDSLYNNFDVDVNYGLKAPSVEKVLSMIPESIFKDNKVSASGSVKVEGNVKGTYGEDKIPTVTLCIQIEDASAKYKGLPYGIDHLSADLDAFIDMSKEQPSHIDLKIFRLEGMKTSILATAKVEELFGDPHITLTTKSAIDLDAMAKTFPLQKGLSITGTLDANVKLECRLSSLQNQDLGRIKLFGDLDFKKFNVKDAESGFDLSCDATLRFKDSRKLAAALDVRHIRFTSPMGNGTVEKLTANISSTIPKDTTHIIRVNGAISMSKLNFSMGDSVSVFNGVSTAEFGLRPGVKNPRKPLVSFALHTDSLSTNYNDIKLGLKEAEIKLEAEKVRDSLWTPKGELGFRRLRFSSPDFGLPVRISRTVVDLDDDVITLRNASIRMGRSNITATGTVKNLYNGMTKDEMITARLNAKSRRIDCNQLIAAMSTPIDTTLSDAHHESGESTPASMELFIVPKNLNLELTSDIDTVLFDKMTLEHVKGEMSIKNQVVYLEDMGMTSMGARVNTVMVYRAANKKRGYAGFDLRVRGANIAKVVEALPSMDSIIPMLRSFKGRIDMDITAEGRLDSALNIRIPSLHAAMYIRGDSLVLMDGETFAEISKTLMFKNKKHNLIDSISVNITVKDGNVTIYPFVVEIDRYRAAVGGRQGLDMNFDYHVSVLKSPLPFKAGIDITGNLDNMKYKIVKAKYKDAITPVEVRKVEASRVSLSNEILARFSSIAESNRAALGRRRSVSALPAQTVISTDSTATETPATSELTTPAETTKDNKPNP